MKDLLRKCIDWCLGGLLTRRKIERSMLASVTLRVQKLEQNQAAIIKKILELETMYKQQQPRAAVFATTVMKTSHDENNKGLNDNKPTIH